jgi:hypothetical protein
MSHYEMAECPHCGKTVFGKKEIEELFGYRYGGTMPQSWCKECRARGRSSGGISAYDAALIWMSNGKDEDYTFGYSEDELQEALK